jgi:uncharacterized membrane protein YdbT with pleckstrin-like domain
VIQQNTNLKLPLSALYYAILQAVIYSSIVALIVKFIPLIGDYAILMGIVLILLSAIYTVVYFFTFSFQVNDKSITMNRGVFFKTSKSVNFNDLQNVQIKRGPFLMMFGLARVQGLTSSPGQLAISSAGHNTSTSVRPDIVIVLTKEDATELAQIMRKGDL